MLYPNHMHLTRGNHETKNMNKIYGFDGEVKAKYSASFAELFHETFCWLPLGFVLNGARGCAPPCMPPHTPLRVCTRMQPCLWPALRTHSRVMRRARPHARACVWPGARACAGKVLVVHGGLFTRDDVTLDEMRAIDRFRWGRGLRLGVGAGRRRGGGAAWRGRVPAARGPMRARSTAPRTRALQGAPRGGRDVRGTVE